LICAIGRGESEPTGARVIDPSIVRQSTLVASPSVSPAPEQRDAAPAEPDEEPTSRSPDDERRIAQALAFHFETVWRSLRRFGVSDGAADDAAQRVFLAFADRVAIVQPGHERPYLIGIAAKIAANVRRQQARSREEPSESLDEAPSSAQDPESLLLDQQRRQRLDEALSTLPELQRQVFVLYELEGFSMPEIACALGIPLGTAASRLRRARESFEQWVREHLPASGES
jgi:RNA polymerase sigma-70 factor, ECF subfamily